MHYGYDELDWVPSADGWARATVTLWRNDTAWNPASTKRDIYGPARIEYTQGPDGGVDAAVSDA
jgi:hypothetical protein